MPMSSSGGTAGGGTYINTGDNPGYDNAPGYYGGGGGNRVETLSAGRTNADLGAGVRMVVETMTPPHRRVETVAHQSLRCAVFFRALGGHPFNKLAARAINIVLSIYFSLFLATQSAAQAVLLKSYILGPTCSESAPARGKEVERAAGIEVRRTSEFSASGRATFLIVDRTTCYLAVQGTSIDIERPQFPYVDLSSPETFRPESFRAIGILRDMIAAAGAKECGSALGMSRDLIARWALCWEVVSRRMTRRATLIFVHDLPRDGVSRQVQILTFDGRIAGVALLDDHSLKYVDQLTFVGDY